MKHAVMCLLLLSACTDLTDPSNQHMYKLTWYCQVPEGCERTEQVALIDRAKVIDGYEVIDFLSSRDDTFYEDAQMVPSDDLPADCSRLYGLGLFTHEIEPPRFCHNADGFELELSIPNRESTTHSQWLVEGREIDE